MLLLGKETPAGKAVAEVTLQQEFYKSYASSVQGTDRFLKDLELHVLENCSHWVQQDKPEEVHKLMRGFLERTDAASPATAAAA